MGLFQKVTFEPGTLYPDGGYPADATEFCLSLRDLRSFRLRLQKIIHILRYEFLYLDHICYPHTSVQISDFRPQKNIFFNIDPFFQNLHIFSQNLPIFSQNLLIFSKLKKYSLAFSE